MKDSQVEGPGFEGRLHIFPNPATNHLYVKWDDLDVQTVKVLDLAGRQLLQIKPENQEVIIQTSELEAGTYLLELKRKETSVFRKFVVVD